MPTDPATLRTPPATGEMPRPVPAAPHAVPRRDRAGPGLLFAGGGPELGLALVLSVVLAFGAGLAPEAKALWPFDRLFERPPVSERVARALAEAIRIDTSNPPGNERALAAQLRSELRGLGIESRLIETPGEEGAPPRGALWARWPAGTAGAEPRPALVLLSHLDTVPADPAEWSVDPFAGEIWDGFVWGRGALDAKGVAVAQLMAMVAIAEAGIVLDRDLILLATPDEETGGRAGAGWLVEHHPELIAGAGYLLTEGGGITLPREREGDRPPVWGVAVTEKAPCWLELRARGRPGHSSSPTPDAAVPRLIAALDRIRRIETPLRITPQAEQMFAALSAIAPEWDRAGYLYLAATLEKDEGFRRRFLDDPARNALVRDTISITVLEGAPKTNVAPAIARAQLDIRLLPGASCSDFAARLADLVDDEAIEIEELLSFPAIASPTDTPLFAAIEALAARQPKPGLVVPRLIAGFTDAHWFRDRGLVAYGFVPRALTPDDARRVHGIDERISVSTLTESVRAMVELILEFDRLESATRQTAPPRTP